MSSISKIENLVWKEIDGYSKLGSLNSQNIESLDHLTHTLKSIQCIKKDISEGDTTAHEDMSDSEKLEKIETLLKMLK